MTTSYFDVHGLPRKFSTQPRGPQIDWSFFILKFSMFLAFWRPIWNHSDIPINQCWMSNTFRHLEVYVVLDMFDWFYCFHEHNLNASWNASAPRPISEQSEQLNQLQSSILYHLETQIETRVTSKFLEPSEPEKNLQTPTPRLRNCCVACSSGAKLALGPRINWGNHPTLIGYPDR